MCKLASADAVPIETLASEVALTINLVVAPVFKLIGPPLVKVKLLSSWV